MPLPWNEIRIRAAQFAEKWKDEANEQAEKQTFWNEFFQIYGMERRSVAIYEKAVDRFGERAKGFIDLYWPGVVIVEHKSLGKSLDTAYDQAADYALLIPPADQPRYIITSDFRNFRLYDLDATDGPKYWQISLKDLAKEADKFSFISGYKKQEIIQEDPVNRRAAERLAELHDQLKATSYNVHDLEVLLVRILFCLFAEDSGIFEKSQFHDFIYNETDIYGSDLGVHLMQLFDVLNTPRDKRQSSLNETLRKFPYVNGKLFAERISTPTFDHKMRDSLLNAAHNLDWSSISPAIFGAMFQGVMEPKQRRSLGAHYTSEQNILKVIKPLFLDEFWEEFEKVKDNRRLLNEFHEKIAKLTFFDPACGCGNFLVVSYRELRKLELEILKILHTIPGMQTQEIKLDLEAATKCNVDQFYGIEIEEFPAQIAQVAMWLTDTQMNNEASDYFGKSLVRLPLIHSPTILHGDALELDWHNLISPSNLNYLYGNPPFIGKQFQTKEQKLQITRLFHEQSGTSVLDYVACWYAKALDYIKETPIQVAFVSTNSITQGEQVSVLWPYLLNQGVHITFAHRTFQWMNSAAGQAGVHCVIVGFSLKDAHHKRLFEYVDIKSEPHEISVKNISPYLVDGPNIVIQKRSQPLSDVPRMDYGSMANDKGYLLLSEEEKQSLLNKEPEAKPWIKSFVMGEELINNISRYALWLVDITPAELNKLTLVKERVEAVGKIRSESKREATNKLAKTPALFGELRQPKKKYLALPRVSSENREYIPMKFLSPDVIAGDKVYTVEGAMLYHFGILTSAMHMAWMRQTAGRLESRYSYSNLITYNNFPWPNVSNIQQKTIDQAAQNIIDARSKYPDSSLAELYDRVTMPPNLVKAHQNLDREVEKLYRKEKFTSDTDRMQFLLEKYQELVNK